MRSATLTLLLVCALTALLLPACDTEAPTSPEILSFDRAAARQGAPLILYGEALGAYVSTHSAVYINGQCAEIEAWGEEKVALTIPAGVGVGDRILTLVRADGQRDHHPIFLEGPDLPPSATLPVCEALLHRDPTTTDLMDQENIDLQDEAPQPDLVVDEGFLYIAIDDRSGNEIGRNPGVDLDAIHVRHADGSDSTAEEVIAYLPGPMDVENLDPSQALGFCDAYPDYPDLSTCLVWENSVALGGEGRIVLRMSRALSPGDVLEIYEVGSCEYAPELYAISEAFTVQIAEDPAGPWSTIGAGAGPVFMLELLSLP